MSTADGFIDKKAIDIEGERLVNDLRARGYGPDEIMFLGLAMFTTMASAAMSMKLKQCGMI